MLNPDQKRIVSQVYTHLIEHEHPRWNHIDDYILMLEYLDDSQLYREVEVIYEKHKSGTVGCSEQHSADKCFVPLLVEGVGYLLSLYREAIENENPVEFHHKNTYVFHYYLALDHAGLILVSE
jgi:hypothetical protein